MLNIQESIIMNGAPYIQSRLDELSDKDISTIETPADFRECIVIGATKTEIGKVTDLLFDIESKKVRYLVVLLYADGLNIRVRKILAPVGLVKRGETEKSILIPELNEELINALPDYEKGKVNPGVENIIRLAYTGESESEAGGLTGNDFLTEHEDFYNHFHFDTENLDRQKPGPEVNKKIRGLFDDSLEAEKAVTELIYNGFSQDSIEISSSKSNEISEESVESSPIGRGSMVAVKTDSAEEALKASEILDKNGSVSVFENFE